MRTVSSSLNTATTARTRTPVYRATLRDMRLRFGAPDSVWTSITPTNPWGAADETYQLDGQDAVAGDQLALSNGKIVRAHAGDNDVLYVNWVDDPTNSAQWSVWRATSYRVNDWGPTGQVGMVESGGYVYIFYHRYGGTGVTIRYILVPITTTATTIGTVLATISEVDTGLSLGGALTLAPVSPTEVYVGLSASVYWDCEVWRCYKSGSTWYKEEAPLRFSGIKGHSYFTQPDHQTSTYFDAFTLNGRTFVLYSIGCLGQAWCVEYRNGQWANPRMLMPDDQTAFRIYRASVIDGRVFVCGRVERNNLTGYSPMWDAYLYSDDGENWTLLARDSYLTTSQCRGKLHLSGAWVYYAGLSHVLRAPATYTISRTAENTATRLVIGDHLANWADAASWPGATVYRDFKSATASFPSPGTAPQVNLTLAAGNDSYNYSPKSDVLREGGELTLDVGYVTDGTGREEYVTLLEANIDTVERDEGPGARALLIGARDAQFKKIKDWSSPFYWPLASQLKYHDPFQDRSGIELKAGAWDAKSPNLLKNGGFESDEAVWGAYWTGSADKGTERDRTMEDKFTDAWSYKISKYGNPGERVGTFQTGLPVKAGKTYTAECQALVQSVTGGTQSVVLEVTGAVGAGGAWVSANDTKFGATEAWVKFTCSVTAVVDGTLEWRFYFDNNIDGMVLIDDCYLYDAQLALVYEEWDTDGLVVATNPIDTTDFDQRAEMADMATVPAQRFQMGLTGCIVDKDNLLAFVLQRDPTGTHAQLIKKRAGIPTVLASVNYAWSPNVKYDLRFVQRRGHIWCYAKLATDNDWGAPLFTNTGYVAYDHYVWAQPADPICPSQTGRGQVGLRGVITPGRFLAYLLDMYSNTVAVHRANADDWTAFPNDGVTRQIKINDEIMTYQGRSPNSYAMLPGMPNSNFWASDPYRTDVHHGFYIIPYNEGRDPGGHEYSWPHVLDLHPYPVLPAADDAYNDYVVTFVHCAVDGAQWRIIDSFDPASAGRPHAADNDHICRCTTDDTGHAQDDQVVAGSPNWIVYAPMKQWEYVVDAGPGLFNVLRGQAGTDRATHPDRQLCHLVADDALHVYWYIVNDFETDWTTESLLRRICAFTGVTQTQFDNYFLGGPYTLNNWDGIVLPGVDRKNFELHFDFPTPASGSHGAGVHYRSTNGQDGMSVKVYLQGGLYQATFEVWDSGGSPIYTETTRLMQPLKGGLTNHFRLVVNDNWHTVYVNGATVLAFWSDQWLTQPFNYIYPIGMGALTFTNFEIDELDEYREVIQLDNAQSAQAALDLVTEDRPIKMVSRSGQAIKWSTFDLRPNVYPDGGNTSGTFGQEFYGDSEQIDEGDRFSMARLEAEDILELLDTDLLRDYGFLFTMQHMSRATNEVAIKMLNRTFRETKEGVAVASEPLGANYRFEPEDRYQVAWTTPDTGRAVSRDLIVNNIDYELGAASAKMTIAARRYVTP